MSPVEKTKIELLTRSKNMLIAAEHGDWQRYSDFESGWQELLELKIKEFGSELNSISPSLLDDNQKIQILIKKSQSILNDQWQNNSKSISSLKQYLK